MTTRSRGISLAALCLTGCVFARSTTPSPAATRFALTITAVPADTATPVTMRLDLPAHADSVVVLKLPNEYAGRSKLYENIVDLRASSPGARIEPTSEPDKVRLIARPGVPASVTWRLRSTPPSSSKGDAHNFSD